MSGEPLPLCVDLDETLVLKDTFYTAIQRLFTRKPWLMPLFAFQFLKGGRPAAKAWMTTQMPVDPARLMYRASLVDYLRAEKARGRKLYLVSAAHQDTVDRIHNHLNLFDAAFGTSGARNLKGKRKADFIIEHLAPRFAYAGDSFADLAVWDKAEAAILCGPKVGLLKDRVRPAVEAVFDPGLLHRARGARDQTRAKSEA